ncbi:MAG: hypothetical protein FWE23_10730 [Chitinivibrionia bacterium]|nr:hypothetical protein [Chitinivibrionia bacterium]
MTKETFCEYFHIEWSNLDPKDREIKAKNAFDVANENRKFEIEHYWKRASYYWVIQISIYTGYFYYIANNGKETQYIAIIENTAIIRSATENVAVNPTIESATILGITILGFLSALAWHLSNQGSKKWQESWENHVYYLEDIITTPLSKYTSHNKNFSVSKINDIVSASFVLAWLLTGIKTVYTYFAITYNNFTVWLFCGYILCYTLLMLIITCVFYVKSKNIVNKNNVVKAKKTDKYNVDKDDKEEVLWYERDVIHKRAPLKGDKK